MSKQGNKKAASNFNSRFGYIMVAAGAAIGLGNIWKFPYLAYGGGGGAFIVIYIVMCIVLGHPVVEMESAIGRYARTNGIDAYGVVNKKWKFAGAINILCTILIDMYYIIVSGYVLKYAIAYLLGGNFGADKEAYYMDFISNPVEPLIYAGILMIITVLLLAGGITELVEKVTKVIMPLLFVLLIICGFWALFSFDGAIDGLKFYLIPDFSKVTWKTFSDACMQVMFSVGIGWSIFVTLGASVSDDANIRKDSMMVTICDTTVALTAGFVIIPTVVGAGSKMSAGPSLIFLAMTDIFSKLPGGNIIGFFFFTAIIFAVLSTYFTILEIPVKCVEEKFHINHRIATVICAVFIFIGGIFCSLSQGHGLLSGVKLPWWAYNTGVVYYNIYDWIDSFSGYILLPLGCLLTAFYCCKVWGYKEYEKELTKNGRDGKLSMYDKVVMTVVVPVLTLIVILNCFGFIN
ncbi:sodium-dependent transporter [Dorea acetigenes]|uniref:Sodium-dependent transporter n=1 Tax=Dorea acetigenes TaxID=2981787 RepID=A0ABT2RPE0_9FIRM|nr:sodium-dependent transporter [Dorea acetigenes]MCB6415467.1 sodium-dependent transporter [Faecalimonas umbilicata]MCU6687278.1 sodium-dependent transporter [Dorea acetigenes]SCJ34481.1 Na+-dependent transporters of the SNF family [uncultured Clostridium sp.]